LALNIVHAVEFSRNGRTRFTTRDQADHSGLVFVVPSGHPEGRIRMLQADEKTSSRLGIFVPLEEGLRGLSAFPLSAPVGQRMNTLRRTEHPRNSTMHPGRVARVSADSSS